MIGWNAQEVIKKRYSRKDEDGQPIEDWSAISNRIATAIAGDSDIKKSKYFKMINDRVFIPNTPCIVNAGKKDGQLAACFVLDVPDSIDGIFDAVRKGAMIHKTGGGTGYSFDKLRPAGAPLAAGGVSSGPVSFMKVFNEATNAVKQGGVRRGANMAVLRVDHPSILDFIHMKNDQTTMTNFNISVTVTDEFMEAVKNKRWYSTKWNGNSWNKDIIDPLTGKGYRGVNDNIGDFPGRLYAPDVWNRIVESAWKYAEPGIIFIDEVNRHNLLKSVYGDIATCNPCGEQFLHSNNACNLGSIDLSKIGLGTSTTFAAFHFYLYSIVTDATNFLNDVIDVAKWPLPEIEEMVKATRPVGLGIMGFADLLLNLKLDYRSQEARDYGAKIMKAINHYAWLSTMRVGGEAFPALQKDGCYNRPQFHRGEMGLVYQKKMKDVIGYQGLPGNYQVTTIAPTGTISLIAECSSGIEPNFSWAYYRRDSLGERYYVHPLAAKELGVKYDNQDPESIKAAAREVERRVNELPSYFVTADQISAEDHVRMLAAFQPYVDNSISKTCNGASTDTVEDVDKLYRLAHELKVKCVSYYRDGSREGQVLTKLEKKDENLDPELDEETVSKAASMDFSSCYGVLPLPDGSNKVTFPDKIIYPIEVSDSPKNKSILDYLPKQRPSRLEGVTHKIHMNGENLYVTINKSNGAIIEVFTIGNMISESVGRLLSTMLRKGVSVEEIIKLLQKTQGQYTVYLAERCCTSPEQVIARLLDMELKESQEKKPTSIPEYVEKVKTEMKAMTGAYDRPIDKPNLIKSSTTFDRRDVGLCLECSRILIRKNGCWECICGYSKCG